VDTPYVKPGMKTTSVQILVVIVASCLFSPAAHADAAAYANILRQRETVLAQILAAQESRLTIGHADENAIFSARMALYSFRRDAAKSKAEKIKHQEMIVEEHAKRLEAVRSKAQSGGSAPVETLRATDSLLHAKQILEELRLNE
jgi:hypothetical protein